VLFFRAPLLRLLDFREEALRLLDFREEALRPPLLRLAEDFRAPRRDDFLALDLRAPARFLLDFRAPPLLRPEDPDRDLFLPLLALLDFLAAAMGRLRVGGFVERIARFAHNNTKRHRTMLHLMQHRNPRG
jgi:hypothetical protein